MNKKRKITKQIAAWALSLAMVATTVNLPAFATKVKAEEISNEPGVAAQEPSVTAYATKTDLVNPNNFTLSEENGKGVAQKVNFGAGKTWYIAGADKDGTLVFMCDPANPFIESLTFSYYFDVKEYDGNVSQLEWGTYDVTLRDGHRFSPNHYGSSDIRAYLKGDALNAFSDTEKSMMVAPVLYLEDRYYDRSSLIYSISDKLYLANGDPDDSNYITVGSNSSSDLNCGIQIGISGNGPEGSPFTNDDNKWAWLRGTFTITDDGTYGMAAKLGESTVPEWVDDWYLVLPAFNMDMTTVLFASAAPSVTSDASITDTMTFRMNGADKVTSSAIACKDRIVVTKGAADNEYLYIQGKDGDNDWVYSKQIKSDEVVLIENIQSAKSLSAIDLTKCEIWIETTEDNVTYAKEIDVIGNHNFVEYVNNKESGKHYQLCENCGAHSEEAPHKFEYYSEAAHSCVECGGLYSHDAVDNGACSECGYVDVKIALTVTKYASNQQLRDKKNFALDKEAGGVAQKVNFGNEKIWYIAGEDKDGSLVLICDPHTSFGEMPFRLYEDDEEDDDVLLVYDGKSDWGTYENGLVPGSSVIYKTNYAVSDVRAYLNNEALKEFTDAEQDLMQNTKVYTYEAYKGKVYSTSDKLYLGYGVYYNGYFTVGTNDNSVSNLNNGIVVGTFSSNCSKGSPYGKNYDGDIRFWLRAPSNFRPNWDVFYTGQGNRVGYTSGEYGLAHIVPVFNLNMASVLFASAAPSVTADADFTDTMTLRMNDVDKVKSSAVACTDRIAVIKGTADDEYLYIQGKDGDNDWVYSKQISSNEVIMIDDLKSEKSLSGIDLTKCKIWIETKADNVTYAKVIVASETHDFSNNGTCACGAVDKVQNAKLAGYTISLKENIGVNLYMSLSEEIVNDPEAKLVITLPNGTENEILVSKATKSGTGSSALYIFSSGISAKEMTADIKAQIVLSDGRVGDEYTVTIQDYAKFIIDNSVVGAANYNASYEKSAPLVKSMMNYGAAAQVYFDFMTDKLANSILDDEDKVIPTEIEGLEDYNYTYPTPSETTSFAGSSLILKDAVRMKFVVKSTETLTTDNVSVTIDGTPISSSRILIETDGANQNITVTNLKPNEYGKSINVTAAGLTLNDASVYGYIYKSQASSKTAEAMKNLGRALYFYGVESAKYSK